MSPDNIPRPHAPAHSERRTDTETLIANLHANTKAIEDLGLSPPIDTTWMVEAAARLAELQAADEENDGVIALLSRRLAEVVYALKGEPPPNGRHSYHDLGELCAEMKAERDQLQRRVDEAERERDDARALLGTCNGTLAALRSDVEAVERERDELRRRIASGSRMHGYKGSAEDHDDCYYSLVELQPDELP